LPGEAKSLITAFIWALTAVILTDQTRRIGALPMNAMRAFFAAVFLALVIPFSGAAAELREMSARTAVSMVGSGILAFAAGDTLYLLALRVMGASITVPVTESAYPLFTFLLAWLWLDESFSTMLLLGTALVVLGIVFLTSDAERRVAASIDGVVGAEEGAPAVVRRRRWVGLSLIVVAPFLWALSTVWLRAGAGNLGPEAASFMRVVPVALILVVVAACSPAGLKVRSYRLFDLGGAAVAGVLGLGIATLLYVSAIEEIGASRTAVLTATVPLFTLPLAVVFLRERITPRVIVGTLVCTLGIWFII
jgi:drug/metabolite transporter (DMT)-like permease